MVAAVDGERANTSSVPADCGTFVGPSNHNACDNVASLFNSCLWPFWRRVRSGSRFTTETLMPPISLRGSASRLSRWPRSCSRSG